MSLCVVSIQEICFVRVQFKFQYQYGHHHQQRYFYYYTRYQVEIIKVLFEFVQIPYQNEPQDTLIEIGTFHIS